MAGIARQRLMEERKSFRKNRPFGFFARPCTLPDGTQVGMKQAFCRIVSCIFLKKGFDEMGVRHSRQGRHFMGWRSVSPYYGVFRGMQRLLQRDCFLTASTTFFFILVTSGLPFKTSQMYVLTTPPPSFSVSANPMFPSGQFPPGFFHPNIFPSGTVCLRCLRAADLLHTNTMCHNWSCGEGFNSFYPDLTHLVLSRPQYLE